MILTKPHSYACSHALYDYSEKYFLFIGRADAPYSRNICDIMLLIYIFLKGGVRVSSKHQPDTHIGEYRKIHRSSKQTLNHIKAYLYCIQWLKRIKMWLSYDGHNKRAYIFWILVNCYQETMNYRLVDTQTFFWKNQAL